jgi:hypothetical protein
MINEERTNTDDFGRASLGGIQAKKAGPTANVKHGLVFEQVLILQNDVAIRPREDLIFEYLFATGKGACQ